jgi:hypothetical protein
MKARFIEYLDASFSVRLAVNSQNGMPCKIGPNSEKQCYRYRYNTTPKIVRKAAEGAYHFRT